MDSFVAQSFATQSIGYWIHLVVCIEYENNNKTCVRIEESQFERRNPKKKKGPQKEVSRCCIIDTRIYILDIEDVDNGLYPHRYSCCCSTSSLFFLFSLSLFALNKKEIEQLLTQRFPPKQDYHHLVLCCDFLFWFSIKRFCLHSSLSKAVPRSPKTPTVTRW